MSSRFLCLVAFIATINGSPLQQINPPTQLRGDQWGVESRKNPTNHGRPPGKDNIPSSTNADQKEAATGHGGHGQGGYGHGHGHGGHDSGLGQHGHGKYFQYAHVPDYGAYEFGYRRGNDYHKIERYEKAQDWKFKTKVKWGDKYAGYGEMYWDYNHVDKGYGHGGGGGGHGHGHDSHGHGHGHGHYSEQVPVVSEPDSQSTAKHDIMKKRESKRQDAKPSASNINPRMLKPSLSLDPVTGEILDERTGKIYRLQPIQE